MSIILFIIISIPLCLVIHEGGHYLMAWKFGEKLKFRFDWDTLFGVIKIPGFAWDMPVKFTARQKEITALAGFGMEIAAAFLFAFLGMPFALGYALMTLTHLALYPFYAGDENDFDFVAFP